VGQVDSKAAERRRSPRFGCGGRAAIYCLPNDGRSIEGTLRNLSVGGICLDLAQRIEPGAQTEVLVRVNACTFRAAALVKGQTDPSATSLQFLKISAGGRDMLKDVLAELARVRLWNQKLRGQQIDADTERRLTQQAFRLVPAVGAGLSTLETGDGPGSGSGAVIGETEGSPGREIEVAQVELIDIDLFV